MFSSLTTKLYYEEKDNIFIFVVLWPIFSAMFVLDTFGQEGLLAHKSDGCNAVSAKSVKSSLITFGFIVLGTKLILSMWEVSFTSQSC